MFSAVTDVEIKKIYFDSNIYIILQFLFAFARRFTQFSTQIPQLQKIYQQQVNHTVLKTCHKLFTHQILFLISTEPKYLFITFIQLVSTGRFALVYCLP